MVGAHGRHGLPVADVTIDARGQVVPPGLVNTHHHRVQSLTPPSARRRPANSSPGCGRLIQVSQYTHLADNDFDFDTDCMHQTRDLARSA